MLQMLLPGIMGDVESALRGSALLSWLVLAVSFYILAKSADLFVDSSVSAAGKFNVPKLVVGLVLVSFATTAPELCVSLTAALKGNPEMALGNAIGSVICNTGLALGLAGIVAPAAIKVLPAVLRTSGIFLIIVAVLCFIFVRADFTLSRMEGAVLVAFFTVYLYIMFRKYRSGAIPMQHDDTDEHSKHKQLTLPQISALFALGLSGIIAASEFIVIAATSIAHMLHVPEAVIALTLVALGTSIPEVATCIISAKKGHGEIAVGNILGANILNICWVAGASSIGNSLVLSKKEISFMFPAMFAITGVMLFLLWKNYRFTRIKGIFLLLLYLVYIAFTMYFFPPDQIL